MLLVSSTPDLSPLYNALVISRILTLSQTAVNTLMHQMFTIHVYVSLLSSIDDFLH
jgi:hypothetical protein